MIQWGRHRPVTSSIFESRGAPRMGQGFDEHHCTSIAFFGQNWQQLCGMGDSMLVALKKRYVVCIYNCIYIMQ